MTTRVYVEEITDPVTGEVLTFRASSEAELQIMVEEQFGVTREDLDAGSVDPPLFG